MPPLTPELPHVYVVCVMKPYVLRSSGNFNTNLLPGTGVLLRRLRSKSDFECPEEHLDHLWKLLPEVTKVIVVGWRGSELHFLRRLDELLPPEYFFT